MKVAIIKYNAGNVFSVKCALSRIGVDCYVSDNPEEIKVADKVLFPGVGEASSAMRYLKSFNLDRLIKDLKQPTLGICIGMQLMCQHSEEGNVDCLGIFDTQVRRFVSDPIIDSYKIPHMGWNTVSVTNENKLLLPECSGKYVYYVHSYYADICCDTVASTHYINDFSAILVRNNFYATQFHPEKSGDIGETILKNFIDL